VDKGLVKHEWKSTSSHGIVTTSLVVIGVRPGNPRGIRDWADLARPGLKVLTPSPKTSGGAMWNIAAMYGAAMRAHADSAAAEALLSKVLANVAIMDKGARESMLTFEQGIGDAIITYENEVLTARQAGEQMDYVIPSSTILIENPVAIVDAYAERRGTSEVAEEFVRFLVAPEAQRMFAGYGYRPVNADVAKETASRFPATGTVFTIADLGGWPDVVANLFAPGAAFDRAQGNAVKAR
jgi:sulfate/thiosulfate transport system substrate-binding protein